MKKVMCLVLAAGCVVSGAFAADDAGHKEFTAVYTGNLDNAAKIAAYKDIAGRYPALAVSAATCSMWLYVADKKPAEAVALADEVISKYPTETNKVMEVITCKAGCLARDGKAEEALELLKGCLRDYYPSASTAWKGRAKHCMGTLYGYYLGDYESAIPLEREAIDLLPPSQKSLEASLFLSKMLKNTGRGAECSKVCVDAVLKNAAVVGGTDKMGMVFSQVDPGAMGLEKYREFLTAVLLRVPAVEANAKFLGRVKSEAEKVK